MKKVIWNVYSQFRCIAEKCPDSCCQGWEVDVDPAAAQAYRALEGPLGDRLRQVLRAGDDGAYMVLENGRCPMWRQDGLCQIQAELGHDALCRVCAEYPRLYMDFGDYAEWGLEMSCPEAARLLFGNVTAGQTEIPGAQEPEYDRQAMAVLQRSREELLAFWKNSDLSVPQRLAVTLYYAHQLQEALDGAAYTALAPRQCLENAAQLVGQGDLPALIRFFSGLEILTDSWKIRLQNPQPGHWDSRLECLAMYLIRRYWLQAVWDYDLVCRAKLIVSGCILVNALGGDPVQTSQLFSKEIENDPDNRETILDGAYTAAALTDTNLLSLLLGC